MVVCGAWMPRAKQTRHLLLSVPLEKSHQPIIEKESGLTVLSTKTKAVVGRQGRRAAKDDGPKNQRKQNIAASSKFVSNCDQVNFGMFLGANK